MIESKHAFRVRDLTEKVERRVNTTDSASERVTDKAA